MDIVALLRQQVQNAHQTFEGTLGELAPADAHREPGGRAYKVAANYAHLIFSEDAIVNGLFRGERPLFAAEWAGRTGFSEPMPSPALEDFGQQHEAWARRVTADLPAVRAYGQAVEQATEAWVGSLSAADLDRPFTPPWPGTPAMPLAMAITVFVIGHAYSLAGEMSAGKGVLGFQGYPF
jgi:hypothetical protein